MVERLAEDHKRAKKLADGLRQVEGLDLDVGTPATNMVFASLVDEVHLNAKDVAARLKELGILVGVVGERRFRLVTHY